MSCANSPRAGPRAVLTSSCRVPGRPPPQPPKTVTPATPPSAPRGPNQPESRSRRLRNAAVGAAVRPGMAGRLHLRMAVKEPVAAGGLSPADVATVALEALFVIDEPSRVFLDLFSHPRMILQELLHTGMLTEPVRI